MRYDGPVGFLAYLAVAFKLWMVIDAVRRRVNMLWYLLLMLPLGDWIYFFTVKLADFNVRPGSPAVDAGPTLEDLRREASASPSFHNRARLAWALLEAGEHVEAAGYFEQCLRTHPRDRDARHGLGLAWLGAGDRAKAIEVLQELVEHNVAYDDYGAALRLAGALFEEARQDEALALFEVIARHGRRIDHDVELARHQIRADRPEDARATLARALERFEALPDDARLRSGATATEARRLLRTLEPGAG